jgi:hypothetical protein
MTDRLALALSNPIDPGDLDALAKCASTLTRGSRNFGTILAVDKQRKEFHWHVSVTLLDSIGRPTPIVRLTELEKVFILRLAWELLADVGWPNSEEVHEDEKSVHLTRRVTIEEERRARNAFR